MTLTKAALRRRMHSTRRAWDASELEQRSRAICARIQALACYVSSRSVALYWPIVARGEVDVRPLFERSRAAGKATYFPFMGRFRETRDWGFRRISEPGELQLRGLPFAEPGLNAPRAVRGELDMLIVPALVATTAGHRLGYGAGFYDVVLPQFCPPARSAVVVFDFQIDERLPTERHDYRCDWVVTEQQVLGRQANGQVS